jgi:hypothetical protein
MMRKLLANIPVHVFEVGAADAHCFSCFGLQFYLELNIVIPISLTLEVR